MRLLNLWPQSEVVAQPVRRFTLEAIFATLVAIMVTLCLWLWVTWRLLNLNHANDVLQNKVTQLQQQRTTTPLEINKEVPNIMRHWLSGGLDWMGHLTHWTVDGHIRWISAKTDKDYLILEGAAKDKEAIEQMLNHVQTAYPNQLVQIDQLSANRSDGVWWRFSMRIGMDTLLTKAQLLAERKPNLTSKKPSQETLNNTAPEAIQKNQPQASEQPLGVKP